MAQCPLTALPYYASKIGDDAARHLSEQFQASTVAAVLALPRDTVEFKLGAQVSSS